jgi:N-acetylmuramoyl-L-alanine amidase
MTLTPNWEFLVDAVKLSNMTDAMKAACVAQAIIESGRGTSKVAHVCVNFWGIKMRPELVGLAVGIEVEVTSEESGKAVFASFPSTIAAVKGWQKFLTRSYYKGWEEHKDDSEAFLRHIGKSWCPAAGYAEKVIACLAESRKLLGLYKVETKKGRRVLLDPGHSNKEPGARSNDGTAKEEALTLLQAQIVRDALEKAGFDAFITNPEVDDIEKIGDSAKGYDLFLSLHLNSYDGDSDPGTEVFVVRNPTYADFAAAKAVCNSICNALKTTNRGVKEKNFTVIRAAGEVCFGPVMLVESFFLNPYNAETAKKRAIVAAEAIADALISLVQ